MVRERQKIASRRQISRLGVPVTVTDYETVEDTSYGPKPQPTAESPYTVEAVPDPTSETEYMAITGETVDYEMLFLVADDDAESMNDKTPGEELATEIGYMGTTFGVDTLNPYHNAGVVMLGCNS